VISPWPFVAIGDNAIEAGNKVIVIVLNAEVIVTLTLVGRTAI
jgi:hypothetical protein